MTQSVTIQPQWFEEVRIPVGMRVRISVNASEDVDVGVLNEENYGLFCEADDESGVNWLQWHEEVDTQTFLFDSPERDICWLILWNAYEDNPVSVEYEIVPA